MFTSHSLDMIHYLSKFTLNNPIHSLTMIEITFTRWGKQGYYNRYKIQIQIQF